jgi:hypothetical protein
MKLIWETSNIERPTSNIERGEFAAEVSAEGSGQAGCLRYGLRDAGATDSTTKDDDEHDGKWFAFWEVRGILEG